MNLFDARFYQNSVNFSEAGEYDHAVRDAANMAIWLYIDKEKSLAFSCKVSAKKKGVPVSRVEKCLRLAIPPEVILERKGGKMSDELKQDVRQEKIADYQANKHFKTI